MSRLMADRVGKANERRGWRDIESYRDGSWRQRRCYRNSRARPRKGLPSESGSQRDMAWPNSKRGDLHLMETLNVAAGQAYATLSAAIAASRSGGAIAVRAGTYVNDFATFSKKVVVANG
jgi:hypothetical protein